MAAGPHDAGLVDLEAGPAVQQLGQRDPRLHPRGGRSQAMVRAMTERHDVARAAAHVEFAGIREYHPGDQLRAASYLIAEHAEWRAGRADLSAGESAGDFPVSSDWHDSDDAGCDLAYRAIALLCEVTGQTSPAEDRQPAASSGS